MSDFYRTLSHAEMIQDLMDIGGFSRTAAGLIIELLEDMSIGATEWDPVAIRCEFAEYGDMAEALEDYGYESSEDIGGYWLEAPCGIVVMSEW